MPGILHPIEGVTYCDPELAANYVRDGGWIDMTVGQALATTTERFPGKNAFVSDERTVTFSELNEQTDRLGAALLDIGFRPGDRAIFQMGTTIETVIALLASYKIGLVPVCAVPQYREVEINQLVKLSQARGYFVQGDPGSFDLVAFAEAMIGAHDSLELLVIARARQARASQAMEELIARTPLDVARARLRDVQIGSGDVLSFQLSGGTTGIPKIIPRFHAEYLGHTKACLRQYGMTPDSKLIWTLPIIHNAGQLYALISVVLTGMTTVLMPKVDIRRMLELIEEQRVTHAISIGPVSPQIIAYEGTKDHDLSSLRLFATMSRADSLEAHIRVPCANLYGTTEGLLLCNPPEAPAAARHYTQGASGCPLDEIRLLDPASETPVEPGEMGELCFRGPSSLRGYFGAPEANATAFTSDGFFRTGDMMVAEVIEGRTYYAFRGRLRDNINRGGEKIGCEEVEAFVSQHPAVSDAKLVAMPDPIYGEKGCVFLVLRPGQDAPTLPELVRFLVEQGLAKFKCPERIEVVDSFPVTRVGKLDKPALRAMVADMLRREESERSRLEGVQQ
ncbi:AMP-binding protein [Sphingomonas sp.]|uniref:AMP-binding protein n=1 Tax=Sphingomonas sp. TaxID=28214 RepID=UPI0025E874BA|nr:AMP-binding protein [Sphingomonas sp.]MBV9529228.1 AMP-binding protein [Sphingomonas sp.]